MRITAVVMCYNEADFIYPCLQQIIPLADQTIVWDGDFWIGNHDPGRPEVLTQASSDGSRDLIQRAISDFGGLRDVETAYFDGLPKMAEHNARNLTLQMATGDYVLIVDADELWTARQMNALKALIKNSPDVSDFSVRNRLFFWNPYFYVNTKHDRLFRLDPGREFYGANEVTREQKKMIIPQGITGHLFNHYGYLDPKKVAEKMQWYDGGAWRGCGSWWFENIYQAFDGTLECAQELMSKNYGTLHPWGKMYPGFACDEFTPLVDQSPEHPAAIRQYFDKRGFDISNIRFV